MKRDKLQELKAWKDSVTRKPMILFGARQVGKTWLLKEFGKTEYNQFVYVNFEDTPNLKNLFEQDFDINRILKVLEIHSKIKVTPEDTLIIFDEIQEAEKGVTVLKYFVEKAPEYHVIAAGSLLGIAFHKKSSFPVGKVDFMNLYPLSFTEFLNALGEETLSDVLKQKDWATLSIFKEKLTDYLRFYFFIGGMPEVVASYVEYMDLEQVRYIQNRILLSYQGDFSKHAPNETVPRIQMVWQSIVSQLSKENKKFVYGLIREGARAKDFELAIQWLTDSGLLLKCHRVSKPELPLSAFLDLSAFKLYFLDTGLLVAMSGLDSKTIIEGNMLFSQFKGAITEQFIMQHLQLKPNRTITYWTNERSTSEVDFVMQENGKIIPIEVKSGENLKAKSFKLFCEKYKPEIAYRTSLADYKMEGWMTNVPVWAIESI
jgi:uncharacterized protein